MCLGVCHRARQCQVVEDICSFNQDDGMGDEDTCLDQLWASV